MRGDVGVDLRTDAFSGEGGLVDRRPFTSPSQNRSISSRPAIVPPSTVRNVHRAQLAEVEPQRADVDLLVGADALDDLGRLLRVGPPIDEQVGDAQDLLGLGEAESRRGTR